MVWWLKCETANHRTLLILVIVQFISTKNLFSISSILSHINIADFKWYHEIHVYMCAIACRCVWEQIKKYMWGSYGAMPPICQTTLSQMSAFFSCHWHSWNPTLSEDAQNTHTHAQTRARINIWWHVDSLAIDQFHPYAVDQAEIEYWVNGQQLTQRRLGMLIQRHFVYDGWRQIGKVLGLPINSNQEQSSITLRYHTRVHTKLYK